MSAPMFDDDLGQLLGAAMDLPFGPDVQDPDPFAHTSLGDPTARFLDRFSPRERVDGIVAGSAPPRRPVRSVTPGGDAGLVGIWEREVRQLLRRHGSPSGVEIWTLLRAGGHPLTFADLLELLGHPGRIVDRDLAAAIVTALGGRWTVGGFAALYEAARHEAGGAARPGERVVARSVSGLIGAEPMDGAGLRGGPRALGPVVRLHGREPLVRHLVGELMAPNAAVQVLVGASGVGKSAVAQAVARRVGDSGGAAVWSAPAHDETELCSALFAVASGLGATVRELRAAMRATDRVEQLWRLLDAGGRRWLLLLDDAGQAALNTPGWARRSPSGSVLVTSRVAEGWPSTVDVTPLEGLDAVCGGRVVLDRIVAAGYEPRVELTAQAQELSRRLGGMPLALRAVGTFLGSGFAPAGVEELLGASELAQAPGGPQARVRTAYDLSLQGIAQRGVPLARDTLRLVACFAPEEPLPMSVLRSHGASEWASVLEHLVRSGLLERVDVAPDGAPCLRIHAAVAEQARADTRIDAGPERRLIRLAVELLHGEGARLEPGVPAHWPALRRLEPHAEELLDGVPTDDPELLAAVVRLVRRVAKGLTRAGGHAGAALLLQRCVVRTASLGEECRERLGLREDLAWLTGLRGDLRGAEAALRSLLAREIRLLGRADPRTLTTRDRLAWALAEQGEWARAELRLLRLLPDVARVLGERHPDTLAVRHRLAWVMALQGRRGEAVEQLEQVLVLRTEVLGPDHMDVFSTRYRLAWALAHRGRLDEAEQQFSAMRADLEQLVGAEHPMTLMVRSRLAWVRSLQNRYDDAEAGFVDLLADQEKVLGPEHARTLRTRHMLATLLLHRGLHNEAELRLRALLQEGEVLLGPDHHDTFDMRYDLALAVARGGYVAEAERMLRALLADRQRVSGRGAPRTLVTALRLARVLVRRGQLDEAEALLAGIRDEPRATLEADSRLMFDVRHTLAFITGLRGRLRASEQQLRALQADRAAVLGPDDRETLAGRDYLSWALGSAGHRDEAAKICRAVLADRSRVFGPEHPTTLFSRYRLAWLHACSGRYAEAEQMFAGTLAVLERIVGPASRDALRLRGGLAWVLRLTGRLDDAEQACRHLVDDRTRVHGPDDVGTLRARDALGLVILERGRLVEAEAVFRELLADMYSMVGHRHRDTLMVREHLARARARRGFREEAARSYRDVRAERASFDPEHPDRRRPPPPELR